MHVLISSLALFSGQLQKKKKKKKKKEGGKKKKLEKKKQMVEWGGMVPEALPKR